MQLHILSLDLATCAEYTPDQHVRKLAVEALQVASTGLHYRGAHPPYKPTHAHHPLCVRAGTDDLFLGLCVAYCGALLDEQVHRFGASGERTTEAYRAILACLPSSVAAVLPEPTLPSLAACDVEHHRALVRAKRVEWATRSRRPIIMTWTRRPMPDWMS